ncbi:FAD binding domain-containing protein [Sphaerotilaceae bacterium SBD11-9]
MSSPGHPKSEYRSAQHEGAAVSVPCVLQPPTPAAALALKHGLAGRAAYVGGGTALQLAWGVEQPPPALTLIDVSRLPALQGVALREGPHGTLLRLGAATRLEALRTHPLVRRHAPLLGHALETLAALSVRHLATLGGNIGWRWGDTLAPLLVLGARVEVDSEEHTLALADVLAQDELPLLRAVQLPLVDEPGHEVYEKVGLRAAFSPTHLALALRAQVRDRRVVSVQAAATAAQLPARRLLQAERLLAGAPLASLPALGEALREALSLDLPGAAPRVRLVQRLLQGHLMAASP